MIYLASLKAEVEDKVNGMYLIKTREKLDKVVADSSNYNKVVLRNDFVEKYFTPTGIVKYVENARKLNKSLKVEFDQGRTDTVITLPAIVKKLTGVRNLEELIIVATKYPKEVLECIEVLAKSRIEKSDELIEAASKVTQMQMTIDKMGVENSSLEHRLGIEQQNKFSAESKLNKLVARMNYQYNAGIDENKIFRVDNNNKYCKVIYIKEITKVQYVDSLVYYLKEICKIMYNMPTRLLVIESYYASGKVDLYKDLTPHYALNESDVASGDILMLGLQPRLMEHILQNASNTAILIVLDRAGYAVPHIQGDNVELIFTASDKNDVPEDVPKTRQITYSEETLYIPYIQGLDELDNGERIAAYSSMQIVRQLIELIERST